MTVKDIFDVEGMPAGLGMKSLLGRTAQNAEAVASVRKAGAVVWGHTNVPAGSSDLQTYNKLYGVTRNPWDLSRTPGGSSGGSAAALAATVIPIGSTPDGLPVGLEIIGPPRADAATLAAAATLEALAGGYRAPDGFG